MNLAHTIHYIVLVLFDSTKYFNLKKIMCFLCPICLEPFLETCTISSLHCGHMFHEPCISQWILGQTPNANHCPQCRAFSSTRPRRLFPTFNSDTIQLQTLHETIYNLQQQVRESTLDASTDRELKRLIMAEKIDLEKKLRRANDKLRAIRRFIR